MATQNSFKGANLSFVNTGIHFLLAEVIKFRKQLTVRKEFLSLSGWDNALKAYISKELEKLADTLENVTYNPDPQDVEDLKVKAADTTSSLADKYNAYALAADNILMPVPMERPVVWDLTGGSLDLPQITHEIFPNDAARTFIAGLDQFFVEATRLDSRFQPHTISKYESLILHNILDQLYTLNERKGGELMRSDTPQGTLPSQEPATFQGGSN